MHGYSRDDLTNYSHLSNDGLYLLQDRTTQNHALDVTIDDDADEIDELVESSLQSNLNLIPELLVDYFPPPPPLPQVSGISVYGPDNEPVNNSWPSCHDSTYDDDVVYQQSTMPSHSHQYRYHPQQADSYRRRQPSSATTRAVIPNTSHVIMLPRKEKR
jgi:hypothetical protein